MQENTIYSLLERHLPPNAVHYAYDLWVKYPFNFKVTRKRNSKYGDYRYNPKDETHSITVNGDMNPYAFLVTYIHEIAHLLTYKSSGRKLAPHGKEWKRNFQLLMEPMLSNLVFPDDILAALSTHMQNPKATSSSDHHLSASLRKYDRDLGLIHLGEIELGETFKFNKRVFQKEHKRRTRILCQELNTGKKYLISQVAMVERLSEVLPVQKSIEEKSFG